MSKKIKQKNVADIKKVEYYKQTNAFGNIEKLIFPNTIQVGLNSDIFNSTISGSIHHTRQGLSYLVAGSNITIASASNGQVTIAATAGSSGVTVQDEGVPLATAATTLNFVGTGIIATGAGATKTITVNNTTSTVTSHVHNFWLSATPSGDPTSYFYGAWYSSTLSSVDPELATSNYIWKYFPYGGEIKKVYGFGDSVGNSSSANPFVENAVFAIYKWSDEFITGYSGASALRPAIFHVTSSPGDSYTSESGAYYHRATYDFDLTTGTGSPTISAGDTICISFKGEGGGSGFGRSNFFMHWDENIS